MKIFDFRNRLIDDYSTYVRSFIEIRDARIRDYVERTLADGHLWPEPLIQMNPAFEPGSWIDELVREGVLHSECAKIFRKEKDKTPDGHPLRLHKHQAEAVENLQETGSDAQDQWGNDRCYSTSLRLSHEVYGKLRPTRNAEDAVDRECE